jgi:hypothetical protein
MIRGNPPPRGTRLSAAYLRNQHDKDRSQEILDSDQYTVEHSTRGYTLVLPEGGAGGGGGILVGVITGEIAARTGVYPSFTYGAGTADIFDEFGGVAYSTAVYSTFREPIPASAEPVIFGVHPSGMIFFVNGDCPP